MDKNLDVMVALHLSLTAAKLFIDDGKISQAKEMITEADELVKKEILAIQEEGVG